MHFDAIIIGAGQAGTPLAFRLASENQKVAFIEKSTVGGTCVNNGCTPTKSYVSSARRIWDARHGESMGIYIPEGTKTEMKKVKARKDKIVGASVNGIIDGVKNSENIQFFKGTARFVSDKRVRINDQELSGEKIYLNVGARPRIPDGFGDVNYLTNETILELEEVPEHLIMIGGSYIGLEFGQMFRRFGSKVTIVEKGEQLIPREDKSISDEILNFFKEDGINVRLKSKFIEAKNDSNGGVTVKLDCGDGPKEIKGSHLLVAAGRIPNTDLLDLQNTGIKTNERGYIQVNDRLETDVKGVYALGDCNGEGAFTHTSYNDYEILIDNLFGEGKRKVSDRIITYCLYTDPPLGRAGLTLKQAQEKGYDILYGYKPMSEVSRANEKGETRGFMDIIIDAKTEKILGAAILGTGGDEIIGSILNAMYAGTSYKTIRVTVIPHPTVTELIPTMLESLEKR